jgi:hypothetical protein
VQEEEMKRGTGKGNAQTEHSEAPNVEVPKDCLLCSTSCTTEVQISRYYTLTFLAKLAVERGLPADSEIIYMHIRLTVLYSGRAAWAVSL